MASITQGFKDARAVYPVAQVDLTGRTVVITGANAGLGFEAALCLAKLRPARIIFGCRSVGKGEAAAKKLEAETGFANTEVWTIDMLDERSVKAFGDKIVSDLDRLDVMLCNAGILMVQRALAPTTGFTTQLQVNTISTTLLARTVLPKLVATARLPAPTSVPFKPHMTFVGSVLHNEAKELPGHKSWNEGQIWQTMSDADKGGTPSYGVAKASLMLMEKEVLHSLPSSERDLVILNTVDPGLCDTDVFNDAGGLEKIMSGLAMKLIGKPAAIGGRVITWAAVSPTSQSAYISGPSEERQPSPLVRSETARDLAPAMYRELENRWRQQGLIH